MTTQQQERRLQAVEAIATAAGETGPRTWIDIREDAREFWGIVNSLFCPGGIGARPFPEREQSYWEERLREEQRLTRETEGMTIQQAYGHIIHQIMCGSDTKEGDISHGDSEKSKAE